MKRLSALLLAIVLLTALSPVMAEGNTLRVGNPTPMRGEFFTELWGNATSDIDVRMLLHGCNLVYWDGSVNRFTFDRSVLSSSNASLDAAGNKVFTLKLKNDLYYSDGTRITARDYAFSLLLQMSPVITELGGTPQHRDYLVGGESYLTGVSQVLTGVRVPDENTLVVIIRSEYLPFFYEVGLLQCNPYPMHVIAPGVALRDDGDGVYLANADDSEEPVFTAELLRQTILDPETGYMSHPAAVSGPYMLTGWDGQTATFTVNPYYKGNIHGKKPAIQNLVYTLAENETMLEKLRSGEFDLLNKVMRTDVVEEGLRMTYNGGAYTSTRYPRSGLSLISFSCEKPALAGEKVRQAIAWCMDREQIVKDYTGGYGERVNGYYGIGQWMYLVVTGRIEAPVEPPEDSTDTEAQEKYVKLLAEYKKLNLTGLTKYEVDIGRAQMLLNQDGWTLNEDGVRQKEIDGQVVTLDLVLAYPEGNRIAESFQTSLIPNLEKAGIRLTLKPMPMADLLTAFYKQGEREEDMLYLANNFDLLFDPAVNFILNEEGEPNWSYTNLDDRTLYELAVDMRNTNPHDTLSYLKKWVAFQERFNQLLPMIPIYSNYYFDFYTRALSNYGVARHPTWSEAIIPAVLSR